MPIHTVRSSVFLGLILLAVSFAGCGDSDSDGSCDPTLDDDCICETEGGQACADPEDLDCFCSLGGGNNGANNGATDRETVNIADFEFTPSNVTINTGGQVTWTNNDQAQHTVTFADNSIDELINPGASFTATFNTVGVFSYRDRLNNQPGLNGTVTVE